MCFPFFFEKFSKKTEKTSFEKKKDRGFIQANDNMLQTDAENGMLPFSVV